MIEIETQRRRIILQVVLAVLTGTAFVGMLIEFAVGHNQGAKAVGLGVLVFFGLWLLARQGFLVEISIILLLTMVAIVTYLLQIGLGIHDIAILIYPLIIILGTLLLGHLGLWVSLGLVILSAGYIIFAEVWGWIDINLAAATTELADFITVTLIFIIAAAGLRLFSDTLVRSLKKAQEQSQLLEASEARWRSLVENAPDLIWNIDLEGKVLFENRTNQLTGESYLGKSVFDFIRPLDQQYARSLLDHVISHQKPISTELQIYAPDRQMVVWFSIRLGPVMHNAQVTSLILVATDIQRIKDTEKFLRRQAEQLATLNRVSLAVSSLRELPDLLAEILTQMQQALPLDVFYVVFYRRENNMLSFPIVYDLGKTYMQEDEPLSEKMLLYNVIRGGQSLLLNRSPEEMRAIENAQNLAGMLGDVRRVTASLLLAPLQSGGQVIGAISVQTYATNAFQQEHLEMLEACAGQISVAVENTRLYDALSQELAERRRVEEAVRELNAALEERVVMRTRELEAANKELESFSYTVSHDLRAPLRAINGFAHIIQNEFETVLPEEAQRYLGMLRENGQRMGQLIDDLLAFSRLSRRPLALAPVNQDELLKSVLEDLQHTHPNCKTEFLLNPLPEVQSDPGLLRQVWVNLLDNAIKFSQHNPKPRVEVGCNHENGQDVFYVRDNGAGFDMQYAGKLFGVFQRLHRDDEFEGTGIGLATVTRIVQRHGGRVWAEAAVGKGAAFYFTLSGINPG